MNGIAIPESVSVARPDPALIRSADEFLVVARQSYSEIRTSEECEAAGEDLMSVKLRQRQLDASFPGQGTYFNNRFIVNGKMTPTEGYITDHINRFVWEFLKDRDTSKPFAMIVGHKAVHGDFEPSPEHRDAFNDQWFELPKTWDDTYEGRPPYLKARRKSWHGLEGMLQKFNYSDLQRKIAACLISVDDGIGQILDFLARSGELDDTMIIYSSDNGFFRGEHGLNDKRAMYEDSIRVPLLVRYPRLIKPGAVFDQMVLNTDLAPTWLDLAGVEVAGIADRAGERVADLSAEDYLRQSITDPDAFTVEGFSASVMPLVWSSVLDEGQINDLVAFLLTLK